jgi:prevent-host-death family protein
MTLAVNRHSWYGLRIATGVFIRIFAISGFLRKVDAMSQRSRSEVDIDLEHGVVPISKAASSLAALLKYARNERRPIVLTQKGYPAGVILDIESFERLREMAGRSDDPQPAGQ